MQRVSSVKTFPVMCLDRGTYGKSIPGCPSEVPWSLVAPHEKQALRFHDQTLNRLAERGGLDITELYYLLRDEDCPAQGWVSDTHAIAYVNHRLAILNEQVAQ